MNTHRFPCVVGDVIRQQPWFKFFRFLLFVLNISRLLSANHTDGCLYSFYLCCLSFLFVLGSTLRTIDLSGNNITELHPNVFEGRLFLEEISIADNRLQELPAHIFRGLGNLQVRDLFHLRGSCCVCFPSVLLGSEVLLMKGVFDDRI